MVLLSGQILHNRYSIEKQLGQGGMGAVYRARDLSLNIRVAIKENLDASLDAKRQFEHEAQILARLSHPNLPRVTDHFFIPGQGQYLVMDYIEGEDLESMLERLGVLPEPQVLTWITQICDALTYLHSQPAPVIHRDIKPSNIKIRPDGRAVLVDFGIAKVYDPHLATTIGAKAVTPGYSPPEQYGGGITDARSDIYALGATLYHLLTGEKPPESVQRVVGQAGMSTPRQVNQQISPLVENVILKAVEVTTDRRFQSIDELRKALTEPLVETKKRTSTITPRAPKKTAMLPIETRHKPNSLQPRIIIGIAVGILGIAIIGAVAVAVVVFSLQTEKAAVSVTPMTPTSPAVAARKSEAVLTETPPEGTLLPAETVQPTDTPTPEPTPTATPSPTETSTYPVSLCLEADFDGSRCRTTRNTFPNTTVAVYATWQDSQALRQRLEFTRRWLKDGVLILESANVAGENARWTPSDGLSYYVYLSAVEGTGKRVFNAPTLPRATYTFELLINDELVSTQDFSIE